MEKIDETVELLDTKFKELQAKISGLRKKGFDTKIVELKVMNIPIKIKIVGVTKDQKDIDLVNKLIKEADEETKIVEKKLDIRKEIEKKAEEEIKKMNESMDKEEKEKPKEGEGTSDNNGAKQNNE